MSMAYPIREFSRITGVNPVTLRAWERRYGIIKPERTEKGHRLYNDQHIGRVKNILYWLEQGYPIRQVKLLIKDNQQAQPSSDDNWSSLQYDIIEAATQLNNHKLDQLFSDGLSCYPMSVYYEHCLLPVLQHVRSQHEQPLLARSFEYLLKRKLCTFIHHQQKHSDGPAILLATNHEDAEIELLACAYALGAAAFQTHYFGAKLSANDLALAAVSLSCEHLWLHLHPCNLDISRQWLQQLASLGIHLYVSGAVPAQFNQQSDIHILPESFSQQIQQFITSGDFS